MLALPHQQVQHASRDAVGLTATMPIAILAQSVLFVAIFYGISAIWERDLGVLQRYLVSLLPLSALVVGKALLAGVRALASIHRLAPRSLRNEAAIRDQILNDIGKQSWSAGSRRVEDHLSWKGGPIL